MHVLHITNSYGGTTVHKNLYEQLDRQGVRQTIFVPLNAANHFRLGNQMIDFQTQGSRIIYSTALKHYHRVLYGAKIKCVVKDIHRLIDIASIDIIHASTQCLDGAVAYELHKLHCKPYIITVRNTDVNNYYRVLVWRKNYFYKILENARKVIFISPKYKTEYINHLIPNRLCSRIANKMLVIPNGVDPFYLEHQQKDIHQLGNPIKVVFISTFKREKGLLELIDAVAILRDMGYDISLRAIGRGLPNRDYDKLFLAAVDKKSAGKDWITLEDFKRPAELCEVLRESSIFAMPSSPETFGLVYIEALTQNVPILYTKNQGVDGLYPDGFVGYPAEAKNIYDIAQKLEKIIAEYNEISQNIQSISLADTFDWCNIAVRYKQLYQENIA